MFRSTLLLLAFAFAFLSPVSSQSFEGLERQGRFAGRNDKEVFLPSLQARHPIYEQLPTKTLAPIYTEPVVNYHTTEQDIYKPRKVHQTVVQQRLVEQPIIRKRLIVQPIVRRIINQEVVQPRIIETTQLEKKVIEQPVVQPRYITQNVVRQQLHEEYEENKPIRNQPTLTAKPPTKLPTRVEQRAAEELPRKEENLERGEGMGMMEKGLRGEESGEEEFI